MIDSHSHIHMSDYGLDALTEIKLAQKAGVERFVVIGEGIDDTKRALQLSKQTEVYVAVGVHPHTAETMADELDEIETMIEGNRKVVAIGECGLDYYYMKSNPKSQRELLQRHFNLARRRNLPMIFHIRGSQDNPSDAFDDFFEVFDQHQPIIGVVHSFSATQKQLDEILKRGLYVSLNGIMTFSKIDEQLQAVKNIPLDRLLIETDAPFLTPHPYRSQVNSPRFLPVIAEFLSQLRGESMEKLMDATTQNTRALFGIT